MMGESQKKVFFKKHLNTSLNIAETSICKGFENSEVFVKHLTQHLTFSNMLLLHSSDTTTAETIAGKVAVMDFYIREVEFQAPGLVGIGGIEG